MPKRALLAVRVLLVAFAASLSLSARAADLPVAADAHVNSSRQTTNFGYMSNLYVGNGNTAFVQFDLSGLPTGITASQVASAKATFFVNRVYAPGAIAVSQVTSSWTESGVTSATAPTTGASVVSVTPTASGTYVTVDITSLVQGWITTPSTNYGIALTSASGSYTLDSKENDQTGHAAGLDVVVTSMGATGAAGATGAQGVQGIQGVQGATGAAGAQGATGVQGIQGVAGATGATGSQGATGATGAVGATGATGAAGTGMSYRGGWNTTTVYNINDSVSFNGSTYIAIAANQNVTPSSDPTTWSVLAAAGSTGATGATGSAGLMGATGATGAVGATGATGAAGTGMTYRGTWNNVTVYYLNDAVTLNGSTYIAIAINEGVAPPSAGTWSVLAAVGATGVTGPAGAVGATGATGAIGFTGAIGATGATGATGPTAGGAYSTVTQYPAGSVVIYSGTTYLAVAANGPSSSVVTPGTNSSYWVATTGAGGATGPTGATGPEGIQGNQGIQGTTGVTGAVGATGATGGALTVSPTHSGTLTGTASMLVTVVDGGMIMLPAATTAGQEIMVVDQSGSAASNGIGVNSSSTIKYPPGMTATVSGIFISDGAGTWWAVSAQ